MAASLLVRIGADIQGLTKGLGDATGRVGKFAKGAGRLGAVAGAVAVGGIAALTAATVKATRAAAAYDEQFNALRSALQRAGDADVPAAADAMAKFADEAQFMSTFTDDAILSVAALGSSLGIPTNKLEEATQAAMDMSTATGQSLHRSMELIGKSMRGKTSRLENLVDGLDKADIEARGLDSTLEQLADNFGGASAQSAQTYTQRLGGVEKAWANVNEEYGKAFTRSESLNSIIVVGQEALRDLASWIATNTDTIETWIDAGIERGLDAMDMLIEGFRLGGKAINLFGVVGNLALAGLIDIYGALVTAQAKALGAMEKLARWAGADKIADGLGKVRLSSEVLAQQVEETGDVVRSTASDQLDNMEKIDRAADKGREKTEEARFAYRKLKGEITVLGEEGGASLDKVAEKAGEVGEKGKQAGEDIKDGIDQAAKAAEELEERAIKTMADGFMNVAAASIDSSRKTSEAWRSAGTQMLGVVEDVVVKSITARAAEAAAGAAASQSAIPVVGPALAAAAASAMFGLVRGYLSTFHEGGLVRREDLLRLQGMRPGEGLAVLEENEVVVPADGNGGAGGTTINIHEGGGFMPRTRAQQRRYLSDVVMPAMRQAGVA